MKIPADGPGAEKVLRWIDIDPDLANVFLNRYNEDNRSIVNSHVERLQGDMGRGDWLDENTDAIKFDWHGAMFDGQHRLWALIYAKKTFRFLVAFNCDPKERFTTDTGRNRTLKDMLHFEGETVPNSSLAIMRRMVRSFGHHTGKSKAQELADWARHKEAIKWVLSAYNCRELGLRSAAITAVAARAWYTIDRTQLKRFLEILRDGFDSHRGDGLITEIAENTVIQLRNWVFRQRAEKSSGAKADTDFYGKTERTLVAFLNNEKLATIYAYDSEHFPLPEEQPRTPPKKVPPKGKIVGKVPIK